MDLWLVGSILLNTILLIALFLKSFLNDILKEKVKARWERRERGAKLLRELDGQLDPLAREYFLVLSYTALSQAASSSPGEGAHAEKVVERSGEKVAAIQSFIREHRLEFPFPIQELLGELEQAYHVGTEIVSLSVETIMKQCDRLNSVIQRLNAAIRKELGLPGEN